MLAVELLAPLTFFLWLGVSALATALATYLLPTMSWQVQGLLFSFLSVVSIWLSKHYLVKRQSQSELPNLNRRSQQYIGRVFTLTQAIQNGYGKISVDDTRWQVRGADLPEGARVRVVDCEGSVLIVETLDTSRAPADSKQTSPEGTPSTAVAPEGEQAMAGDHAPAEGTCGMNAKT